MDPIDLAVLGLRILLVGCLYAFLVTIVRLASRSLRAAPAATSPAEHTYPGPPPASAASSGLRLMIVQAGATGLPTGQTFEIAERAVLGRAQSADLVLADGAISSAHARVQRIGRGWVITDLGSTNGTRLNGVKVPANGQVAIAAGDVVTLGTVQLQIAAR